MALRTTLSLTVCLTDEQDIKRAQEVKEKSRLTHSEIYLKGIDSVEAEENA